VNLAGNIYRDENFAYNGFRLVDGGLIIDEKTSTKVGVFLSSLGDMAIVFEGSKEPLDWWLNVRFDFKEFGQHGKVHAGFLKSWAAVRGRVCSTVDKYAPDTLAIVGHSRGGGEAVIAAVDLASCAPFVRVVTFGAPRVGDRLFVQKLREIVPDVTRYWLFNDPVPFLPLLKWGYKQTHGGQILWSWCMPHIIKSYKSAILKRS